MKYFILLLTLVNFIILYRVTNRKKKRQLVFTTIINKTKIKILAMQLEKQSFVSTILALIDSDTQEVITSTFSNVVLTSSDPAIFTADTDVNADAQIDIIGVSEGVATLNVKADATYVDANTGQEITKPEEANVDVTVSAPPPTAQNTDLVVTFTNPQPV